MQPVLDQSLHTFRQFAERHGYDVVVGGDEAIADRAPAWSKIVLLRRLLESYDYVLWIDADAIILDDSVDPVDLFGERDYQALVRYRWNQEEGACTGVWILRNLQKAAAFLDAVWDGGDGYLQLHPWEQAAAMRLLGYSVDPDRFVAPTEWSDGTLWLPSEWDTIPAFTAGRRLERCRVRHYARVEPCSPATDAYGSTRDRRSFCIEFDDPYVAPACICGRFGAVEPWLPTQTGGVRARSTDRSRRSSPQARLWEREELIASFVVCVTVRSVVLHHVHAARQQRVGARRELGSFREGAAHAHPAGVVRCTSTMPIGLGPDNHPVG